MIKGVVYLTDVLLIGEVMGLFIANDYGDFYESESYAKGVSGAEMNVAIGLARLGYDVNYISKIGRDPMGKYIQHFIENEHINTDHLIIDDVYDTGLQIKNRVKKDDPQIHYYRKHSAFTTLGKTEIADFDFKQIRVLHITGIPIAVSDKIRSVIFELVKKAKSAGTKVTFDPNIRDSLWENEKRMIRILNEFARYADIIMPGMSEGRRLTGFTTPEDIAQFYHDMGVETVIIKDGAKGAYYHEKGQEIQMVPGFQVDEVVDTVGAGDGFAVGVISGILDKLPVAEGVIRGNIIGSIQIQQQSDNEGLPDRKTLLSFK